MVLSFIIPIYNGEKYLNRCLDSLLSQDISSDLYEIICIDDCSVDNSRAIISEYEEKHKNVKSIFLPQNSKTGTVCNIGLSESEGEYIWIIGQDDWIEKNCLKELIDKFTSNDLDVLTFNYNRVDNTEKQLHSAIVFKDSESLNGKEFLKKYFDTDFDIYLLGYEWRAVFKRNFLINKKIGFVDGVIYEDTTFLFKAIYYSEKIASTSKFYYNYRVNENSITDVNKKYKGALIYEFAFVTGKEVQDFSKKIKEEHSRYSEVLFNKSLWYFKSFVPKIIGATIKEKRTFYHLVTNNRKYVVNLINQSEWWVRLLAMPYIGFGLVVLLKPFYLLKRKLKRKKDLKYCY